MNTLTVCVALLSVLSLVESGSEDNYLSSYMSGQYTPGYMGFSGYIDDPIATAGFHMSSDNSVAMAPITEGHIIITGGDDVKMHYVQDA